MNTTTTSAFDESLNELLHDMTRAFRRRVAELPEHILAEEAVAVARCRRTAKVAGILVLTRTSFVFVPDRGSRTLVELALGEVTNFEVGPSEMDIVVRIELTGGNAFTFVVWKREEAVSLHNAFAALEPSIPSHIGEPPTRHAAALLATSPSSSNGAQTVAIAWTLLMIAVAIIWAIVAAHNASGWRAANCGISQTCPNYSGLAATSAGAISGSIWFSGLVVIAIFAFLSRKPDTPVAPAVAAARIAPSATVPSGPAGVSEVPVADELGDSPPERRTLTDDLARLAELHRSSALTDAEYSRAKALRLHS